MDDKKKPQLSGIQRIVSVIDGKAVTTTVHTDKDGKIISTNTQSHVLPGILSILG